MKRTDGPFTIYEILPGQLYQRGKLHALPAEKKRAGLQHYGVTRTVALAPTRVDVDLEREGTHIFLPIPDGLLKDPQQMLQLAESMAEEIRAGEAVLTMCNAGRNRSGLLSALIVRELTGLPGAAAMEVVRHHRPNALANPHFEEFLRSLP